MEQNKQYSSTVIFSALSAVLFFAPFIQPSLKKEQWSAEEKTFLLSRCRVGNLLWIFLLACLLAFWGAKLGGGSVFLFLSELFAYLIFALLGMSVILLSLGLHFESTLLQQTPIQKKQMLTSFLPLWSSYQRFRLQQFEKPYWWLKEAQLWLMMIWLLTILAPSAMPSIVLITLLGIRFLLLVFGRDVVPQKWKLALHRSFLRFPEELFIRILGKKLSPQAARNVLLIGEGLMIGIGIFLLLRFQLWWKAIPLLWRVLRLFILWRTKTPLLSLAQI